MAPRRGSAPDFPTTALWRVPAAAGPRSSQGLTCRHILPSYPRSLCCAGTTREAPVKGPLSNWKKRVVGRAGSGTSWDRGGSPGGTGVSSSLCGGRSVRGVKGECKLPCSPQGVTGRPGLRHACCENPASGARIPETTPRGSPGSVCVHVQGSQRLAPCLLGQWLWVALCSQRTCAVLTPPACACDPVWR